jgi:hypothetical protein
MEFPTEFNNQGAIHRGNIEYQELFTKHLPDSYQRQQLDMAPAQQLILLFRVFVGDR